MDSQTMRQQMKSFTSSSARFYNRVLQTKDVLERLISHYGETKDTTELEMLFYQMVIDECELLLLVHSNFSEDSYVKELRNSKELNESFTKIKTTLEVLIEDAKQKLKTLKKQKPPKVETIKKVDNNKNLTRELLNVLGLK